MTEPTLINHTPVDRDLVDRIFEYLIAENLLRVSADEDARLRRAVKWEFKGERATINPRGQIARQQLVREVLNLFNGRNAREVARRLQIGRATVYRIIKQAGREKNSLSPGSSETPDAIRSSTLTAPNTSTEPAPWPSLPQTSPPSTLPSPAANSPSATTAAPSPIVP